MKFACYTLGCKVNQYETQAMEQLLMQSGHTLGSFDEICDGYIINTCTVTAVSDKKSRNAIRRVRKLNPNAVVGVCGCYAQSSPDEIRKLDVDVLIGTDGREAFVRHMIDAAQTRQKWDCVDDAGGPRAFEILPAGGLAARFPRPRGFYVNEPIISLSIILRTFGRFRRKDESDEGAYRLIRVTGHLTLGDDVKIP